jgi:hypothetical protein
MVWSSVRSTLIAVPSFTVHLGFDVGVDRQQVVGAVNGDAMAGIIEHGYVSALRALAEIEQFFGHLVAGKIDAFNHLEADVTQNSRHRLGIDRRIWKLCHVLVSAIADDEGDTFVGHRRIG